MVLLLTCLAILHALPCAWRQAFCVRFVYPYIVPLCGVWARASNSSRLAKVSGPKVITINHASNFDP